jgi:hypothetical protein
MLSLETGGLGGDPEVSRRLNIAAGEQAIRNSAWRQRREEAAANSVTRSDRPDLSVWQPGSPWRNTGAFRQRTLAQQQLGLGAREVGEPSAWRGGAGAPAPVAIMRGTTTTYSPGRLPGRQFAEPETATPLEARQAWNRGMRSEAVATADRRGLTIPESTLTARYGAWRPAGQTLTETVPGKAKGVPELVGAQAALWREKAREGQELEKERTRERAGTNFRQNFIARYGPPPKEGTPAYRDYYSALIHAQDLNNPQAGLEHYQESQSMRQLEPLVNADNLAALRTKVPGIRIPTEQELEILRQDPDAWRQVILHYGPYLSQMQRQRATEATKPRPWFEEARPVPWMGE